MEHMPIWGWIALYAFVGLVVSTSMYIYNNGLANIKNFGLLLPVAFLLWPAISLYYLPILLGTLLRFIAKGIRERKLEPLNSAPWPLKKD